MRALAQIRIEENRPEQALNILNRALSEHETSQALHRDVMQLYLDMGRRSEAAGHYQKLAANLKDRNLKPEGETAELYEAILNS
jgi:DNA-binding SARP family transcriptional activator